MTIRDLKVFVSVYETLSMTKTGKDLNINQADISRTIRDIEKEYRIILFERYPNRLTPTDAGNRFYGYAAHIMSTINELNAEFKGEALTGIVRVGSTRALGSVFLPDAIREFSEVNPQAKVVGKVQNLETLTASLIQNEIDFALVEGIIDTCGDELLSEEFRCDKLVLIVPPDFSVPADKTMTVEEVAGYPLVQREPGSINRTFVDSIFRSHGIEVKPVFESFSIHSLVRAVHEGLGLAILPQDIVSYSIASGYVQFRTISDASLERKNYIVVHRRKRLSPVCKAFIEFSKEKSAREKDS